MNQMPRNRRTHTQVFLTSASVKNCLIQNAIIDKNARIGDNSVLVNRDGLDNYDGGNYYIRDGIVIVPKDATIPPETTV